MLEIIDSEEVLVTIDPQRSNETFEKYYQRYCEKVIILINEFQETIEIDFNKSDIESDFPNRIIGEDYVIRLWESVKVDINKVMVNISLFINN